MAANYKVLKIDEMSKIGDLDKIVHYYRHFIKTKGGIVLSVDISEANWNAEKAAPILDKKAIEADKILAL